MKALVYAQPNHVRIEDRPYPQLNDAEVILRIDAAGVCGSDMHAYHGHDPRRRAGLVLGHELAGTVVESAAPNIKAGTRVTANPLITCGHCDYCVQGRTNLCSNRTMIGMTRPGAFAEYMSIPASSLIDMPENMSSIQAALTEPAATALHAINMSMRALVRPLPECRMLIMGGGAIGMLCALLLRSYGCRDITMAEVNPLRRRSAEQNALCNVCNPDDQPPTQDDFDFVIDAVGAPVTRNMALASIKPGGVIMHIGLQSGASEIDMRKLTLAEITLIGSYTYTTADMHATVLALHQGAFGTLSWVETRDMADGAKAFDDLDRGRTASAKVILIPSMSV